MTALGDSTSIAAHRLYPPVKMVQFTGEAFTAGVEELERNGVKLRVYGVAKMAVAAVLLLGDRKWHTFLDPVAPPQKHLRVKKSRKALDRSGFEDGPASRNRTCI